MIPILYTKTEKQFRSYGLGPIHDIISPKVTRERNGQYLLYFQYPQDAEFADVFEEDMRIKSDAGVRTKWQTFEISRVVRKEGQLIEVFAKHISQSLLKDALNPSVSVRSLNAQQALRIWNNNRIGDEEFDVWSDISTTSSTNWDIRDVSNAFEALAGVQGSILDVWGGEYEFDNKLIRLHKEMGRKSPVPLEYGRNITGLEQDQQEDSVYTSVYPFATYTAEDDNEPKTVTLPEYYIDGKYLEFHNKRKIQVVDFSGEFESDDIPTVSRLRTLTENYLNANEVGLPHENLKVEYIDLSKTLDYQEFQTMEEVELNDRLPIFYPKFDITNENAKVVVINYDPVKEENISIELGVIGQSFRTVTTGGIGSRLDRVEKQQDATNNYIVNAKGNRIWFETPEENMEHRIGDTWFEKNGPYDRIRVWNGSQWEVIIDSEDIDKNAKAIAEQQQEIDEARQTADEAVTSINTAVANAGFTSLDETISSVQSISNQAQINSSTAIDNALEAMQQASQAVDNTGSLNIRVDEVENTLSVKADKQTVDDLTGVVDSQALDIQANAQGLALKANQSTVDTLVGTVQSLGTDVGVVAGQISNRVWKTDIDSAIDGIEVGGRNLVLDSEGMYSGTNTSMNHYFELSPYATTNRIINATAITLDFDVITEDFTEGTIVLELQVIDENGTLRFIQNNATTLSRPQANHRVSRTIFLNDLNYEINEFNRVVMYARNFTGSVSIGNPKVSFSTTKSDWTPALEDTDAKFDYIETEWTQTFDTFSQTVAGIDGRVSKQEQTVSGMESVVYDPETGLSSLNTQLANLIQVAVTGEEMTGAISVLEDNLNLRLVAKDEVITQINASTEGILLQADKVQALADVIVDGKLTITDEFIAPNAQIDGAKMADATIGSAKIASLDASKISTGTLDGIAITGVTITGSTFIQESSLAGSTYGRWDRSGITLRDATGSMVMDMNREGINFHGSSTETAGTYINNNLIDVQKANIYDLNVTGINASLRSANFTGNIHVGNSSTGTGHGVRFTGQTIPTPLDRMFWVGYGYAGDGAYHYINNGWRKLQNELTSDSDVTVNQLTVSNIVDASSLQLRNRLRLQNTGLQFTGSTLPGPVDRQMWIGYGYADNGIYVSMGGNWHKHGATISDERLKENIVDTRVDSLSAITSWNFVEFEWKNLEYGRGRQFGLIAQNTSHIANYYDEVDRWEIDSGKQTMMNSHAIQQLALREQNTNKVASQVLQATETNAQRIECLERRIEELEGVA